MPRTGRRLTKRYAMLGLIGLTAAGAFEFTGCSSEADGPCVSDQQYFAEKVWAPILSTKCIACHNPQGLAKDTPFVLHASSEAGFLDTNMQIFKNVAMLELSGKSLVLLKPTKTVSHGGGQVIQPGGPEYQALSGMVDRFKKPSACDTDVNAFFADVLMASPEETLRTAALELAGRLPTEAEDKAVVQGGTQALDAVLDELMTEDAFYTRLKEIYNDLLLTDSYLNNEDAVNLLQSDSYDPHWYYSLQPDPALIQKYGATDWDDLSNKLKSWTNRAIGREPLELIAHVVRENRSFQEVLTADYTVVNPFSAKAYGVDVKFKNEADPNEFVEAKRKDIPHAGVLSSVVLLNRHPTTPTNRNRHRSRMVYLWFLGTDILKTAEQPLDQTKITDFNPTMNNPSCTVCHAVVDPLAGAFHNFDETGQYHADDQWLPDMRPPGFGTDSIPFSEFPRALPWVAKRVADDPRFALSAVYTMFTGLTGQKPLIAPASGEPDFETKFQAYLAQYYAFNDIAQEFIKSNYNLKVVVKSIVKSPYFRARNLSASSNPDRSEHIGPLGGTRLLTPEQLHRKIWAVTGYPWRPRAFEDDGSHVDYLLRGDQYRLLYGGIDSQDVTQRITEPNGIIANIGDRMANEMACLAVPRDFNLPEEQRLLFPFVKLTFEPKDANGFEVQPAVAAIKKNIQYLHKRVLGESLDMSDPEIERTYQLFLQTWDEGKKGMAIPDKQEGHISNWLPGACQVHDDFWTRTPLPDGKDLSQDDNYTIRAWMGVMTYLLSDFRFLYQ